MSELVPSRVAVLEPFVRAGVIGAAEVHLADTLARLAERDDRRAGRGHTGVDPRVLLAAAVAARAPRSGHVGVELHDVAGAVVDRRVAADRGADEAEQLRWPEPAAWAEALAASPLVARGEQAHAEPVRPLVWDGGRLYLHRLFSDEVAVASWLRARAAAPATLSDGAAGALATVFGTDPDQDRQHAAGRRALDGQVTVVVGGPGTGKTRTVARLLAAALLAEPSTQFALCAPTGKAAARMTEAVRAAVDQLAGDGVLDDVTLEALRGAEARTVHRLLGRHRNGGVRHDRRSPLPHDLVVVDETSMVDLPLMADLVDALRPEARLVLVGDPDQLASVEAGTVLADLVGRSGRSSRSGDGLDGTAEGTADGSAEPGTNVLTDRVVELTVVHRFGAGSGIAALAHAVRSGDAEGVLGQLAAGGDDVHWVRPDDAASVAALQHRVLDAGLAAVDAARRGRVAEALAALRQLKVLCATRLGRFGLYEWTDLVEAAVGEAVAELRLNRRWEVGRPFLVTRNDPVARVANGDTGVVVDLVDGGRRVLAIDTGTGHLPVPVARLDQVEPWWAMTIHKSQGSEFDHVVVSLPTVDSPVLTRELLYTAITRARSSVTVLADADTVRRAVQRPVSRASGLRDRLR